MWPTVCKPCKPCGQRFVSLEGHVANGIQSCKPISGQNLDRIWTRAPARALAPPPPAAARGRAQCPGPCPDSVQFRPEIGLQACIPLAIWFTRLASRLPNGLQGLQSVCLANRFPCNPKGAILYSILVQNRPVKTSDN